LRTKKKQSEKEGAESDVVARSSPKIVGWDENEKGESKQEVGVNANAQGSPSSTPMGSPSSTPSGGQLTQSGRKGNRDKRGALTLSDVDARMVQQGAYGMLFPTDPTAYSGE